MSPELEDVSQLLHESFGTNGHVARKQEAAVDVLASLAQTRYLVHLLKGLRSSAPAVAACAAASYPHPLGFDRLLLIDAEPSFALRLHVWWDRSERGADHVHNHRFGLASSIVRGSYDMEIYSAGDGEMVVDEYEERLSSAAGDWQLASRGSNRLRLQIKTRLGQGSSYFLPPNQLHRVKVPADGHCITLFLSTALVGSTTQVFTRPGSAPSAVVKKRPLSTAEYNGKLGTIIDHLADQ
jgi:hypothetical protein